MIILSKLIGEDNETKSKKSNNTSSRTGNKIFTCNKITTKRKLPIVDKPTLQYIIEEAIESGIEEILIVTGRSKKSIEDHFDRSVELELELEQKGKTEMLKMVQDISNMVNIHYIRQKSQKDLDMLYTVQKALSEMSLLQYFLEMT